MWLVCWLVTNTGGTRRVGNEGTENCVKALKRLYTYIYAAGHDSSTLKSHAVCKILNALSLLVY
jgi:hypothetical protein